MKDWLRYTWPSLALLAVILAVTFGFVAWQSHQCEAKGGHEVPVYKGQICVSADGRVIEP